MISLTALLESIPHCNACRLMEDNRRLNIPYIPILPKPSARFVFVGRDPSPRTAGGQVGTRGERSAFIDEVWRMADEAGLSEDQVYITDICKCHWRTSRGTPGWGTEERARQVPDEVLTACFFQWLWREIEILRPAMIVTFGEELYHFIRGYILAPRFPPEKLSATRDKSEPDAERWIAENGSFSALFGDYTAQLVPLRHPGNASSLSRREGSNQRWLAYRRARERTIELLREEAEKDG